LGGPNATRLAAVNVAEGDHVAAGQVVAEFADAPRRDAVAAQAEAVLRQSAASLARIRSAGRAEEINAQRARVEGLRAAEECALHDAARSDRLAPSGATSVAAKERNRFAAIRATAERAEAEAVLQRLITPRREDLAVAEADLSAAMASLNSARLDAALSRVIAPIAGTILKVYAQPGDQVGDDGLLDMADLDRLDVVADVYETDLPRLRQGAPAEILVPGDPHRYPATVRDIGWQVHRTTEAGTDPVAAVDARTVEVRLALDEEGRAALMRRTNMQVQVSIKP
jgi:HlyD family secretion protein